MNYCVERHVVTQVGSNYHYCSTSVFVWAVRPPFFFLQRQQQRREHPDHMALCRLWCIILQQIKRLAFCSSLSCHAHARRESTSRTQCILLVCCETCIVYSSACYYVRVLNSDCTDRSILLLVVFYLHEGEVTFAEMWLSALQLGLVRSNFVDTRNDRRYLFAERSLGCIPMSCRIRQQAAGVREVEEFLFRVEKH